MPLASREDNRAASAPTVKVILSLPDTLTVVRAVSAEISEIRLLSLVVVSCSLPRTETTSDVIFNVSIAVKMISSIPFWAPVLPSAP